MMYNRKTFLTLYVLCNNVALANIFIIKNIFIFKNTKLNVLCIFVTVDLCVKLHGMCLHVK